MIGILRPFVDQFVIDFIDDVPVYDKNIIKHKSQLTLVFVDLRETTLFASPKKKFLCMYKIEYLGHIVSSHGIQMDPKKNSMLLLYPREIILYSLPY